MTKEGHKKKLLWEEEHRHYDFLRIWGKRYAHMKARHEGRSTNRSNAMGKGLMSQEEFLVWCKDLENLSEFLNLYFIWASEDFNLYYSPSIDRIDPKGGYVAGNIQWMGFSDNCEKSNRDPLTYKAQKEQMV